MTDWLVTLGYFGAFIGAFLEGEVMLLTVIQAARMGYLNFAGVLVAFFSGTLFADWCFFLIGRYRGRAFLDKHPRLQKPFSRMERLFAHRGKVLLFLYRFMYGFRIVLPLLFGLSNVPIAQFALYSLTSTIVWIFIFSLLSYFFSGLLLHLIQELQSWGWIILVLPVLILTLAWVYKKYKQNLLADRQ